MDAEIIQSRLGRRFSLQCMPRILEQLDVAMRDPDIGVDELADIVAHDPPLSARLLRAVNSAWYELSQPVTSIGHAASIVGMRGLRNLFTRAPVHPTTLAMGTRGSELRSLWRVSILTGRLCRTFAGVLKGLRVQSPDEMYTCGLIHDIGAIAMSEALGEEWNAVFQRSMKERLELHVLEADGFGFTHNDLGAMLAKRWAMSDSLIAAIRFHHNEGRVAELEPLSAAIHVANGLATAVVADDDRRVEATVLPESLKQLGLSQDDLPGLLERTRMLSAGVPI